MAAHECHCFGISYCLDTQTRIILAYNVKITIIIITLIIIVDIIIIISGPKLLFGLKTTSVED